MMKQHWHMKAEQKHATHLYNAMTGLNHRNPGVVGAARDAKMLQQN